jgi:hypothetical protein
LASVELNNREHIIALGPFDKGQLATLLRHLTRAQ